MKLNRTSGHTPALSAKRRASRIAFAALLALSMSPLHATPAEAAPSNITYEGINNPANTTVDLFDYWITSQGDSDHSGNAAGYTGGNVVNQGINKDHLLIFHGGDGGSHPSNNAADNFTGMQGAAGGANWPWNSPSQYWGPVIQGIVQNTLDGDGYPVLSDNTQGSYKVIDSQVSGAPTKTNTQDLFLEHDSAPANESLNYLFNPNTSSAGTGSDYVAGKAVYSGVDGLFSVDKDGYYIYDSGTQTADYNPSTNRFVLGDQTGGNVGFWPLEDEQPYVSQHNDYSGMHMHMEFSMPAGGYVLNPQGQYVPMTFTFSGDDDVWVFVDGVLVGDVGGIHQPSSLQIDFRTGEVNVNRNFDGVYHPVNGSRGAQPDSAEYVPTTNIKTCFENAGMLGTTSWNLNTFADGTYHTIDFFYLERGNSESNLEIRFNMINTADFTAHKSVVRADGTPLKHDEYQFELTGYDGVYQRVDGQVVLKEGTQNTDALMPNGARNYTTQQPAENGDVSRSFRDEGDKWVYRVGVAADGNVNFGNADFTHSELGNIYRYKVQEVLPADATYDEATGTWSYTKEGRAWTCPRPTYYMQAEVRYDESDGSYYLSKRYYTDNTYTVQYETNFASFHNFENPLSPQTPAITATKKLLLGESQLPLSAVKNTFTFELTSSDDSSVVYARGTTDANGNVTFDLPPITRADFVNTVDSSGQIVYNTPLVRTYKIREVIPAGAIYDEASKTYTLNGMQYDGSYYDVTVKATYDYNASTHSGTVNTPEVTYTAGSAPIFNNRIMPVDVSATKAWNDTAAGSTAPSHPPITFRLYIAKNTAEEGEDPQWEATDVRAKHADEQQTTAEDKTIAANATGDDLTVTWNNLPAIDSEGHAINYIAVEGTGTDDDFKAGAPAGYASALTGNQTDGFTITNTLQPLTLQLTKLAGTAGAAHDDLTALQGAVFTITRLNPESNPPVPYASGHELYFSQTMETDENGHATFGGSDHLLTAGTYRISETTVPAGYQKAGDIDVVIAADGTATVSDSPVDYDAATRTLSIEITDIELPPLPSTGGPGDYLLIVSGTAMFVAAMAIIAFIERRRLEA